MSGDYARILNVAGILANLAGVLILFRWGMPFRVPSNDAINFIGAVNEKAHQIDHVYKVCGYVGLALLILGTALQLVATLIPEDSNA